MSAPRLVEGHVVGGKYSIRALLRHSDVVATYHAVAAPNLQVALKLFDPTLHRQLGVVSQLADVYRNLETLRSDWFGHVIDAGRDPETSATFTATILIATPALADLVSLCPFDEEESANFVVALARALDAAHAIGLVHGGLSPNNVFPGATPYDSCKVVDFGLHLARRALVRPHDDPATAPWLSPEQAEGGTATVASDVFALTLLAFYALTGRSYWRSCRGTTDVATWGRELQEPRTPASEVAQGLSVSLSPALDEVFARGLSVSPSQRFPSAGTFAAAFCEVLGREADLAPLRASSVGRPPPKKPSLPPAPRAATLPLGEPSLPPVAIAPPPVAPPVAIAPPPVAPPAFAPPLSTVQSASHAMPIIEEPPPRPAFVATAESAVLPDAADERPPARRSRAAWVAIPVILTALAATVAVVVMSKPSSVPTPAASATTSSKQGVTSSVAPPEEQLEPDPPAATVDASTFDAAAETEHDAAGDVRDGGTGKEVDVSIWCTPACDWIQLNGKTINLKEPLRLLPGKYIVAVGKTGYLSQSDKLYVRAGKKVAMPFVLERIGAKKPCGKFLKRCD